MLSKGHKAGVYKVEDSDKVLGINDMLQLEQVSETLGKRAVV